jgi:asparagine synthetase B (glutamine-hydrolysing)
LINFCITNSNNLVKYSFHNQLSLTKDVTLYYDNMVEVVDLPNHVVIFCGILWQGDVSDFVETPNQNGQFYAVVFNKKTRTIKVITDFLEDFPVYYYIKDNNFVVTNRILAFSNQLKLNLSWIVRAKNNEYTDRLIPAHNDLELKKELYSKNVTPIRDVKRVGPGGILEFNVDDVCENVYTWYNASTDYVSLIHQEPQYNLQSATSYVDTILTENFNRLRKKYKSLAVFSSCGIDSLTVLKYLSDVPKYGYYGEDYRTESPALLKQLYNDTGGLLHYFDAAEYQTAYTETLPGWAMPSRNADLAPEMYIRNKYNLHDTVIVKGTFGDEIFWHEPWSAMSVAVHQWNCQTREQGLAALEHHYSHQPYHTPQGMIDTILKSKTLDLSIMNYHYNRQHSYLKDDRILLNQMVVSPFIDLRLRRLLPVCDLETKLASILDVQIQKNIVGSSLLKYLNKYKAGGEESFSSINYDRHRLNQLNEFIRFRNYTYAT